MKLIKIIVLFLIFIASPCFGAAENIYVSQAGSGSDFQTNCATGSRSIAWLNDAANWGGGANEVDAGDTVHLCGTLTSPLTIQGSGSSGSVITIVFETDAKFSAATWTTQEGVISATGKDYIVIDGGTNGHIEATDNGTTRTYQNMPRGIEINACDNWEIKNLSIHDLYVYVSGSDATDDGGIGIFIDGTSGNSDNLSIHDNNFTWASAAVQQYLWTGGHDISVYNNTIRYCNAGIIFGSTGASTTWTNASFYNNDFSDPYVWDDPVTTCTDDTQEPACSGWGTGSRACNCFHHEFFHYWNVNSTANAVTGVKVYGNYTHGNFGTYNTAGIYFEDYATTPLIYNNLMVGDGYRKIYLKAAGSYTVANNTMQGWGYSLDYIDGTTVTYKNNISWETAGRQNGGSISASNNNEDAVDPLLDASFKPTASSTMLIGQGAQLNTSFTTDKDGVIRGDTWDIGAYEYGADVTAPTLTSITIGTNGTSWSFLFNDLVTGSPTSDLCDAYTAAMTTAGAITLSYASGVGTNTIVCTGSPTVNAIDTVANGGVDYTQPGNGIEDLSGNDLATFTNKALTNNSTQEAEAGSYTLTVTVAGNAAGELVTSNGSQISCPSTCAFDFLADSEVTLTASHPDNRKETYTGDGTNGVVTMSAAKAITCTFSNLTGQSTIGGTGTATLGGSGTATITR